MARPTGIRQALPGLHRLGRHFWPYIRPSMAVICLAMGAMVMQMLLRILEPWPLKFVIDRVTGQDAQGRASIDYVNTLEPDTLFAGAAIALVLVTATRALAGYAATIGFAVVGNRVLTQVRDALFRHLQTLSLGFHQRARGGDLLVRVIGDIGMIREVAVTAVMPLLANALLLIGMFGVMFWLQWQLTLIVLAVLPLFWFSTVRRSRRIHEVSRQNRRREGAMAATASESIAAIKTVQSLALHDRFADRFSSHGAKGLKEGVRIKRLAAGLERNVDMFVALASAIVLWFGARLVLSHELTAGELVVFLFYLKRALRPLRDFAKYTARLAKASAAGERVIELFELVPEIRDRTGAVEAPALTGRISFRGVSFAYEDGNPVLHDIDLDVDAGTRVAVVGASGSGKSTLVSLVLRLYDPQQGIVAIDGTDLRRFTVDSLRRQIGVVLQDTLLFKTSIRDNITCGGEDVDEQRIVAAAKLANVHGFITALADGYDTMVGERGVTLSNGQRQRIAIARAAIRQSPILILDEPTSGLDPENERLVSSALERLAAGRTCLYITHRPQVAARADLIVSIGDGRIRAAGSHTDLLRAEPWYAAQFAGIDAVRTLFPEPRHASAF